MKFPRPKNLLLNEYPDLTTGQPELFSELMQQFVHPLPQSNMESYITASIDFLKNEQKIITTKIQLNTTKIGVELSFIVTIPPSTLKLKCLIDIGCSKYNIVHLNG